MPVKEKIRDVPNLQGGYNPRLTAVELADEQGPLQTPDARNIALFYPGAVEKRLGKAKQGNSVIAAWLDHSSATYQASQQNISTIANNTTIAACQKVVASSTTTIQSVVFDFKINWQDGDTLPINLRCVIKADSAGSPGAAITNGTSNNKTLTSSTSLVPNEFQFATPPSVTNTTTYWFCLEVTSGTSNPNGVVLTYYASGLTANNIKTTVNSYSTFTTVGRDMYIAINEAGKPGQGLYDYRYGNSVAQVVMAAINGVLYYKNGSSYMSLKTGLATGATAALTANLLFDFTTYKNYMISCDYGTNLPQCWDAVATSTMELGYRMSPGYSNITGNQYTVSTIVGNVITYTATPNTPFVGMIHKLSGGATTQYLTVSAVSGAVVTYSTAPNSDQTTMTQGGFTTADAAGGTIAAGTYRVMTVTTLKSGGFRASAEQVHVSAGGSKKIALTNLRMNSSTDGSQYAWDVDVSATKIFMTLVGATTYYKVPDANLDIGGSATVNPPPNGTTAININAPVAGTENTLDIEYNLPQAYFTNQVDCPRFKFLALYQDMVVGAGDPNNLNSDWFSEQGTMHIWSNQGGYRGLRLGVARDDGQVIKGLHVRNGRLYTLRTKSAFVQNYTANSAAPFTNDQIQSQLGCLSHWSIKDVDEGFKFLSQQGPAICYGSYVVIDPKAASILNLWEANDPNRFNMSLCLFSTAFINESRKVIGWTVASTSATVRDLILRNNYENGTYWLDDSLNANYLTQISDSNGLAQPWSVDLSAQVFQHDSGTNDNGSAINFYWSTPHFKPFGVGDEAIAQTLRVLGDVQSSGTLYIDEYVNQSAALNATYSIDMTRKDFRTGINVGLSANSQGGFFRYVFRNAELDVPVKINAFKFIGSYARYQP